MGTPNSPRLQRGLILLAQSPGSLRTSRIMKFSLQILQFIVETMDEGVEYSYQ